MRKILVIFFAALFISSLLPGFASAAAGEAAILFMEGDVAVKPAGSASWKSADAGTILYEGDSVRTGRNSWAEIGIGEGFRNVVRVKENTLTELTGLGPVRLGLLKGELRSLVERLSADTSFEIKTPTAVCGARGTGWDTSTDGAQVVVDAYEDEVYFYPVDKDGKPVMDDPVIEEGNRGVLTDPFQPITIQDIPPDRIKDWNDWKEDYEDRRGIDEGADIRTKTGQMESTQETSDAFTKGKEGTFEKGQQEKIEQRAETEKTSSDTNY